jgi:hypothetical protein
MILPSHEDRIIVFIVSHPELRLNQSLVQGNRVFTTSISWTRRRRKNVTAIARTVDARIPLAAPGISAFAAAIFIIRLSFDSSVIQAHRSKKRIAGSQGLAMPLSTSLSHRP